jgi:asparagine synthase (glutamine-hydrolysing)
MCGICGIVDLKHKIDEGTIKKMMKIMKHRGPDDEGHLLEKKIGLGHVRLSIIDLSKKGKQPMANDDKSLWIVYNGEIYNYIELRDELKRHGYKFRSTSDSEVLLKAYEFWGKDCLYRLNGMFAFVVYDKKKNILFGARDRFGIKPFYYYKEPDKFIFSSEIKPILSSGVKPAPDYDIIHDFIVYKLMSHSEKTFFQNIKKLLPGHYMEIDIATTNIKIGKWWELKIDIQDIKADDAVTNFKKLFKDSVRLRLRSDVPVGSCLSGGLDSSSVVMTMVKVLGTSKNVKTFSSTYSIEFAGNEKKYVKEVVKKSGATGFEIEPSTSDLITDLEKLVYYQEEPFYSLSPFAQWEVMKLAHRNRMKVLLDGQGSDETMAGYTGYMGFYFAGLFKSGRWSILRKDLNAYRKLHGSKYPKMDILYPMVPKYMKRRAKQKQSYYLTTDFLSKYKGSELYLDIMRSRPLSNVLKDSVKHQLMELLRFEDKSSMAFSIETRLPFLDFRLVEFLFTLPDHLKLKDGKTKYVFREALKDLLPPDIYDRHDKVGFAIPDEMWLKDPKVWKHVKSILTSKEAVSRGIYTDEGINKLLDNFRKGQMSEAKNIWTLVMLELWFRIYIDKGFEEVRFN